MGDVHRRALALFRGVGRVVVLAEHLHVAAQRQDADAVLGFAPAGTCTASARRCRSRGRTSRTSRRTHLATAKWPSSWTKMTNPRPTATSRITISRSQVRRDAPSEYRPNATPPGEPSGRARTAARATGWDRIDVVPKRPRQAGHDLGKAQVRPRRNAATAASLAAFSTAPAVPPARATSKPKRQRRKPLEIGRLEIQPHRSAPVQPRRHARRSAPATSSAY